MLIKLLHRIKRLYKYAEDILVQFLSRRNEWKKFQDRRRVNIWKEIHLSTEQINQINVCYRENYGRQISHVWHRYYTAFTGNFDPNYFPEILYIPEFEYFMNPDSAYNTVFSDKNVISLLANSVGIVTPKVLLSCSANLFRDCNNSLCSSSEFNHRLDNLSEAFIKPTVNTCSGNKCAVIYMQDGKDKISGLTSEQIIEMLGSNFVIQERIKCHNSLAQLYPHSVNTFRIITYRWRDEILSMPIILRIGQAGRNLDNAHAGGMFIAVEDDGTLHDVAFTEFNQRYQIHPDTNIMFSKYKIPQVTDLLGAARKLHSLLPQVGVYNWDFTLNEKGAPVLIEANIKGGSIWLPQIAHGKGAFGDKTMEVLQWLKLVKKLPLRQRPFYQFGRVNTLK